MRERISIFLISVAIIGFQLAIINLLSYSQWHHFAYLAVSIAMLGFGSSGVILSVWANFFRLKANALLPWLFLLTSLFIFLSPLLVNSEWIRFDTFLLFTSKMQIAKLAITCFILFVPFLLGATVIGLFFMIRSYQIPLLYAWNLAGSAVGGILLVWLSNHLLPMHLATIFGFGAAIGGLFVCRTPKLQAAVFLIVCLGFITLWKQPSIPFTSEFKSLSKTLLIPETSVKRTIPLPQGTLEFVESENLRQALGLSLTYSGRVPLANIAFLNAQHYFAFEKGEVDSSFYFYNLFAFPYFLNKSSNSSTVLLQPNSTFFVSQALVHGAKSVTVVEPLKPIADSLKHFPWKSEKIIIKNLYPRECLYEDDNNWQTIFFPVSGGAGGAGLSAIQEQFLFTTNSVVKALNAIDPNGMLVFSSNMDNPPRYSLKLLSMVASSLRDFGLEPSKHLIAIRNWNTLLLAVKKTPFRGDEIEMAHNFSQTQGFDLVHPPALQEMNILSDSTFQDLTHSIIWSSTADNYQDYAFNLKPPTDNSPFFSQFMKMSQIQNYFNWFGAESVPFLELGYFIVWASLLVCLVLAVIAIGFPLSISLKSRRLILSIWIYFSLLGLGYMLLEVALIQRSILTLGNPITASAVIIGALLCFSAIGSYYSSRLSVKKSIITVLISIGLLIILLAVSGDSLSSLLIGKPLFLRIVLLVIIIAPLSILMGMAFPLGMKYLSTRYPNQIPIAWGVNGFFSVLAAPIATIIAVEAGFIQVLLISAALYIACIAAAMAMLKTN